MHGKTLMTSAAAAGVLAAWALAWAADEGGTGPAGERPALWAPGPGPMGPSNPMARIARHLDLTEAQQAEIRAILEDARTEGEALRSRLGDMRATLEQSVRADTWYEDQVRMAVESNTETFVELTVLGSRTMHQVYALLTPEQRAEADRWLERGPRRGHRWFHRH